MGAANKIPAQVVEFPSNKTKSFDLRFEHCGS